MADEGRRSFLGKLLSGTILAGAAGMVSAVVSYLFPPSEVRSALGPTRVRVGRSEDLAVGDAELVLVHDQPVWVIRREDGFAAYSAWCTHRGCVIQWQEDRRVFQCPCHQGLFDSRGNVLAGLPRRPLPGFRVGVVGGVVYVSRAAEGRPA